MSLTFESPTHRGNGTNDAYFTPLNMPTMINTTATATTEEINNSNTAANTPYYTAPINPALHQDFLNAIQARHASQPTVLTTGAGMTSPITEKQSPIPTSPFSLNMGSLANRRQPPPSLSSMAPPSTMNINSNSTVKPMDPSDLNELLIKYKGKENLLLVLDVRSFVQFSHCRIRSAINISIPNTILKRPSFTLDKVYEAIVLDSAREKLKCWESAECVVFYDQQSQLLQENSASAYLGAKLIRAGFKGQLNYLKGNTRKK